MYSLNQFHGSFDRAAFTNSVKEMFLPPSEYATALQLRKEAYDPSKYD